MKARRFLATLLAGALTLLGLGFGGWWLVLTRSPLRLQHQALPVPVAARFVPRLSPLSLYLFSDGQEPLDYVRAVVPPGQRRAAREAVVRLRDGAFASAGLDYGSELSSWLGNEIALALIDAGDGDPPDDWLLSLSSRDGDAARRFLQRFWQTRSLAGTDLQISSYRGMGLISGRAALVGRQVVPIATALINDDLVLIASGRGVLEQALDVSQIDELNLADSEPFRSGVASLEEGVALLSARSAALGSWLGVSPDLQAQGSVESLLAALRPEGRSLAVEAIVRSSRPTEQSPDVASVKPGAVGRAEALLRELKGEADSLAVIDNPAMASGLVQPLLARAISGLTSPLPALVGAADQGPMLVARSRSGWLLGTGSEDPVPEQLASALAAEGLIAAPLQLADGPVVRVWARLLAPGSGRQGRDPETQLQAELAGARLISGDHAWWAGRLDRLVQQSEARQGPRRRLEQLASLESPDPAARWAVGPGEARELLTGWTGLRWLSTLAGQPLADAAEGLAWAVTPEQGGYRLQVHVDLA
ncbi:MAG: DUF3352 domain-containing protein [Cyanobacteriota bacterium]|nr:DUF3352 domain-containing protein [Cyanobacteriota bacterium]